MIDVLLVDDDDLVRAGIRMILEQTDDIQVVGEVADGSGVHSAVSHSKPHVVLMDVRMPDVDGITATARLLEDASPPKVIVLTTFEIDDHVFDALAAGASGFLLKRTPPEELVDAIRVVARGDSMLSPSVTTTVIQRFASAGPRRASPTGIDQLTEREREVLAAMARGWSNQEISEELFIGANTVKTHVSRVLMKLNARDRAQAVVFAFQAGPV